MNRYTKSFSITIAFYIVASITFLYSFETNDTLKNPQTKSDQNVKFTIIQEFQEKKLISKKTPSLMKKEVQKKVIKEKISKIIKKEQKIKNKVKKKQIKKNDTTVKNEKMAFDNTKQNKQNLQIYYTQIKEHINKNKSYPKIAVKRGIEGVVKVQFTISKRGELISFQMIEGKRIFKNSILNAVTNSFPLKPPKGALTSNTKLSLMVQYKLN
jgi:protein TonB